MPPSPLLHARMGMESVGTEEGEGGAGEREVGEQRLWDVISLLYIGIYTLKICLKGATSCLQRKNKIQHLEVKVRYNLEIGDFNLASLK